MIDNLLDFLLDIERTKRTALFVARQGGPLEDAPVNGGGAGMDSLSEPAPLPFSSARQWHRHPCKAESFAASPKL